LPLPRTIWPVPSFLARCFAITGLIILLRDFEPPRDQVDIGPRGLSPFASRARMTYIPELG
jgi:hypothetical protein